MKKGFTLIELLVVIAILIILAVVVIVMNPLKNLQRSRDAVRKHDIGIISRELEVYLMNNKAYPDNLSTLITQQQVRLPKDPKYPTYQYVYSSDNTKNPPEYTLCAYLEAEDKALCSNSSGGGSTILALNDTSIPNPGPVGGATPIPSPLLTQTPTPTPTVTPTLTPTVTPTPTPSGPTYAVVPVIFLASDSIIPDITTYKNQVNASFNVVKEWYRGQLGGKTFDLEPAILYRSSKTDVQLHSQYGNGGGIWFEGLKEETIANGMNYCDPKRDYYFITPMDNIWGGMVGSENLGCSFVLPGTQSIPSHMGRMLGGVMDPGWPEWWADEIREAQGGVAHELGHGFGGECTNGNYYPGGGCNGLPHSYAPSIMWSWWDFGNGAVFLDFEKTKVLLSPFIH